MLSKQSNNNKKQHEGENSKTKFSKQINKQFNTCDLKS